VISSIKRYVPILLALAFGFSLAPAFRANAQNVECNIDTLYGMKGEAYSKCQKQLSEGHEKFKQMMKEQWAESMYRYIDAAKAAQTCIRTWVPVYSTASSEQAATVAEVILSRCNREVGYYAALAAGLENGQPKAQTMAQMKADATRLVVEFRALRSVPRSSHPAGRDRQI